MTPGPVLTPDVLVVPPRGVAMPGLSNSVESQGIHQGQMKLPKRSKATVLKCVFPAFYQFWI